MQLKIGGVYADALGGVFKVIEKIPFSDKFKTICVRSHQTLTPAASVGDFDRFNGDGTYGLNSPEWNLIREIEP